MQYISHLVVHLLVCTSPPLSSGMHSVISMFKSERCGGEGKFILHHFAEHPGLKVTFM